jgi:hypothetical protein
MIYQSATGACPPRLTKFRLSLPTQFERNFQLCAVSTVNAQALGSSFEFRLSSPTDMLATSRRPESNADSMLFAGTMMRREMPRQRNTTPLESVRQPLGGRMITRDFPLVVRVPTRGFFRFPCLAPTDLTLSSHPTYVSPSSFVILVGLRSSWPQHHRALAHISHPRSSFRHPDATNIGDFYTSNNT